MMKETLKQIEEAGIIKAANDAGMSEWVKRLGQQHFSNTGMYDTYCGMPKLGNNYATHIIAEDKKLCKECAVAIAKELNLL